MLGGGCGFGWCVFGSGGGAKETVCASICVSQLQDPACHSPSSQAYSLAHELYGTTRMLLAVVDRGQLAEVCQVRLLSLLFPEGLDVQETHNPGRALPPPLPLPIAAPALPLPQRCRAGGATCGTCWRPCVLCAPSTAAPGTLLCCCVYVLGPSLLPAWRWGSSLPP